MSSHDKKKIILSSVAVKLGCGGGSCRRPKLSAVFHPKPRRHHKKAAFHGGAAANGSNYSSSSWDTTTTTFSPAYASSDADSEIKSLRAVQGFGRIGGESVAVEKDSDDPYLDFRHSMLQMILEKNIYSKDDLKELLNCFLQLNSPYYHGVIVRAFTEIWNGVFSVKPPVTGDWMSRGF
nr:transcription repressor OFP6-like [Ipomoea batatas]